MERKMADSLGSDGASKPVATDLLFVTVVHNLPGISEGEQLTCYSAAEADRLRRDLIDAVRHYRTLFSESYDYENSFSSADYGVQEESFDSPELEIFRSVLSPAERLLPFEDLQSRDVFNGSCAVIEARLGDSGLETVVCGIDLFNELMESGIPTDDSQYPQCHISVETARDFAGSFIERLCDIAGTRDFRGSPFAPWKWEQLRHFFHPLSTVLKTLAKSVQKTAWPPADVVLGRFLMVVDYYCEIVSVDHPPVSWEGSSQERAPRSLDRTRPELSEASVIRVFAESIAQRVAHRVIARLQRMTDSMLSGDDSGLKNTWDEICAQVQYEQSFSWDAYDDTVRRLVRLEIEELQRHEREALWLQTPEGFDWTFKDESIREQYPVVSDNIVEYLVRESIYSVAGNWSNRRIREYLDHS